MYLGIEIGGTKLQLGVGDGAGTELAAIQRRDVEPDGGADGILAQIERVGAPLIESHGVRRIGVAFGGPVDPKTGRVIKSHQIEGWDGVLLAQWCRDTLGRDAVVGNDCNVAALAEARVGAGKGFNSVFYMTVGTGVGGGLAVDGRIFGQDRPAVAEIGHLRPGLHADRAVDTVESLASGWGITAAAQDRIAGSVAPSLDAVRRHGHAHDRPPTTLQLADAAQVDRKCLGDLRRRCADDPDRLTAEMVARAAAEGNEIAQDVIRHAIEALGWAVAQTITLTGAEVVAIGGGVSLMGQRQFFVPLREQVARFVFPPLADAYRVVPTELGELAMIHGAIAVAAM